MENINFETFKKLNTEEYFKLFGKIHQQNVKLNILLENVTMRLDTHEKKLNDILRNQEINQVNNPNQGVRYHPISGISIGPFF